MTIEQAFNEITVAQGGMPSKSGTITGAIDALTDTLAGSDQNAAKTIEGAVRLLGERIVGGGAPSGPMYAIELIDREGAEPMAAYKAGMFTTSEGGFSAVAVGAVGEPISEAHEGELIIVTNTAEMEAVKPDDETQYCVGVSFNSVVQSISGVLFCMPAWKLVIQNQK